MRSLHDVALECLMACQPAEKLRLTHDAAVAFRAGRLAISDDASVPEAIPVPGRPDAPQLVSPREVPQRGLGSEAGRGAFLHAIAHIEFNAINLAWDAVYRFRGMPADFYADWVGVAEDEARHFALLSERLAALDTAYGDHLAHNGLWEMAVATADSCLRRMALVPRVLEARGLDVTPGIITRLRLNRDEASAAVLEVILREEVAHVAAGTRWFHWCCEREGLAPGREFIRLVREVARGSLRGPFNRPARHAAGFDDYEMTELEAMEPAK
ncbi:ferritin-like domain-containing protein [Arenimonas alkanexedens]